MSQINKLKIFNDPIYGFITIPNALIYDLIQHPYFQRLRRISQMGLSYLVYPGANHTRFHHALGCMHLMQKAVDVIKVSPACELIWASPRELLNIFQANEIGCQVITVTKDILKKLTLVDYDLDEYSLDTVKMFYSDALAAGFKL